MQILVRFMANRVAVFSVVIALLAGILGMLSVIAYNGYVQNVHAQQARDEQKRQEAEAQKFETGTVPGRKTF